MKKLKMFALAAVALIGITGVANAATTMLQHLLCFCKQKLMSPPRTEICLTRKFIFNCFYHRIHMLIVQLLGYVDE